MKKILRQLFMLAKWSFYGMILQCLTMTLLLAHEGTAQDIKSVKECELNVNFDNNTLEEIFRIIESKTVYEFVYDHSVVNFDSYFSKNYSRKTTVAEILLDVSQEYNLRFNQVNKNINVSRSVRRVSRKDQIEVYLQGTTITGTVISQEDKVGLPGVNVVIKGTVQGTVTDVNGNYTIDVPSPESILVFSSIGYVSEEISVGTRSVIDITLTPDITALEEIVVVGFGEQKKETLTGSVSSVGSKDLQKTQAVTTSGALAGKISGVNFRQSDGRPGNGTSLQIRNMGRPLYVIDGVQKDEGQFNNLDYNDIESVTVLKDASAAIYGVRAANGVVVVKTKSGKRDTENKINLNSYYGVQEMFKFPEPANVETYIRSYIQSDAIQGVGSPRFTMEDLEKWSEGTEKGYRPWNWYDYVLISAPQAYIGLNTSGGSEKINYYVALSHLSQDAAIKNYGGFYRTNLQFNLDANITEKLKIGGSINGRIEQRKHPGVPGGDDTWQALFAIYRNLPTARPFANDNPKYPAKTSSLNETNFGMLTYDLAGRYEETWKVMQLNFDVEYEIVEGLKAKGLMSYYYANKWMDNHEYTYKLYTYDEENDTYPVVFHMNNPWRERDIRHVNELMTQFQLNYENFFGRHYINVVAASESYKRDEPGFWIHSRPASNSLSLFDFATMDAFDDTGKNTQARLGYIGRLSYNFDEKYLIELSARYDGSWKFPPNDRWGLFPSASVGWRISEEGFWQPISTTVSELKIRASYGLLGDDDLNDYGYFPFDYMSGYNYNQGEGVLDGTYYVGAQPRGLPVTNLTWLKAKMLDIGIDFGLFNNKLTGSLDYFDRIREGIPASRYDVLIPSEVGFGLPQENLNSDRHRGMDGSLNFNSNIGSVTFSIGGTFTFSRMYDWHQYKPRFGNSWDEYRSSIDERYAYLNWGLESTGQFQSWEEIANHPVDIDNQGNKTLRPGDLIYKDMNGDGQINWMDERPIGFRMGATPNLNYGLNLYVEWKGIDLSAVFTGGASYTYEQLWEAKNPFHDGGNMPQYVMEDQWHLSDPTDPDSELIPGKYPTILVGNGGHSNYWNSTFWKTNGRYVKLNNLEIGYSLPGDLLERIFISKARIYVTGQNLFSIDNMDGIDPEIIATSGIAYPTNTVTSVGLNVTF